MALISLNPKTIGEMAARLAELENKCVVVIDNTAYHSLSTDDKALMYAYYKSVDEDGEARWIIPESEIDEIFAQKHTFYIFKTEQIAVDNCCDWFPQPQNLPNAAFRIPAYVVKPNGTIPYINENPTDPG
jgi:hypothetical protein|tara:strand:+ start:11992 stop:12381 length:390 start_codon:yes stop_codon:yes gene_type:complete